MKQSEKRLWIYWMLMIVPIIPMSIGMSDTIGNSVNDVSIVSILLLALGLLLLEAWTIVGMFRFNINSVLLTPNRKYMLIYIILSLPFMAFGVFLVSDPLKSISGLGIMHLMIAGLLILRPVTVYLIGRRRQSAPPA
jgi:uncharacterized membrane protein YdjX (TVP38/TMEM64 family)